MSGCFRAALLCAVLGCFSAPLLHADLMTVNFNFNSGVSLYTTTPFTESRGGMTASFSGNGVVEPGVFDASPTGADLVSTDPKGDIFISFNLPLNRLRVYFATGEYGAVGGETLEMTLFGPKISSGETVDALGFNPCYSLGNPESVSSCPLQYPEGILSFGFAGTPAIVHSIEISADGDFPFAIESIQATTPVPEPPVYALVLLGLMTLAGPCVFADRHRTVR